MPSLISVRRRYRDVESCTVELLSRVCNGRWLLMDTHQCSKVIFRQPAVYCVYANGLFLYASGPR